MVINGGTSLLMQPARASALPGDRRLELRDEGNDVPRRRAALVLPNGYRYTQATGIETIPTCADLTLPSGHDGVSGHVYPMFDLGLPNDPRFGVIPEIEDFASGQSKAVKLTGFWAMFTYRLYETDTKIIGYDAWVFDPALIDTKTHEPGLQFGFQPDPVVHPS
jgi:hypothetical protein